MLVVEGIIISKILYRDRDLICRLLLRNGKSLSVLFYGGAGGGRKNKGSILELGYALRVELKRNRRKREEELFVAQDWNLIWDHKMIRKNFRAFNVMCFYLEILGKVLLTEELHWDEGKTSEELREDQMGPFRVGSNAIFYLDESLKRENFEESSHILIFLIKLLFELGVSPRLDVCCFCERDIREEKFLVMRPEQGGFSCAKCFENDPDQERTLINDRKTGSEIYDYMCLLKNTEYKNYEKIMVSNPGIIRILFFYFCYQFHLEFKQFKTLGFINPVLIK